MTQDGERRRRCPKEHPGGVHLVPAEAAAVEEMFKRYSTGTATLNQLAAWLNGGGFRTRNTKKLVDDEGKLSPGPKRFTTASVRGILHNAFYTGTVRHRNAEASDGAFQMVITGAVGYPLGDDPSGIRLVKVLDDGIQHEYFGLNSIPESVEL